MVHQTEMAFHFTAVTDFIEHHRRGVLIGFGVAAVAGLSWGLWSSSQSEKGLKARDQLHQALNANDENALKKVAEGYANTRSGFDAWMELGKRAATRSEWEVAVSHYDRAAQNAPSKLDASLATLGLGTCLQALGKKDEAVKKMNAHLGKCDPAVLPEMLLAIGSKESLNRIVSEFNDTDYAQKARQALAELSRNGA